MKPQIALRGMRDVNGCSWWLVLTSHGREKILSVSLPWVEIFQIVSLNGFGNILKL